MEAVEATWSSRDSLPMVHGIPIFDGSGVFMSGTRKILLDNLGVLEDVPIPLYMEPATTIACVQMSVEMAVSISHAHRKTLTDCDRC